MTQIHSEQIDMIPGVAVPGLPPLLNRDDAFRTSMGSSFPAPEQVQQQVDAMLEKSLSLDLLRWVEAYADVGQRDPYLWRWCHQAVEVTTLPCVEPDLREELCDTKTLGVMFDVLMDDVADQNGDPELLEELVSLPLGRTVPDFSRLSPTDRVYGQFALELWQEITARAKNYPCYKEYADLLRYDYLQLCNVMRYSHLLNSKLELLNLAEHDLYTPHNMHIVICSTFDLMCSPNFDRSELSTLRDVAWNAQWMGRIGNLITTWQRELEEGDFTSGVYARAVTCGDLSVAQLKAGDLRAIENAIKDGEHELHFLHRWETHRQYLLSKRAMLRSFDVTELVAGLDKLICLHLGSRGNK